MATPQVGVPLPERTTDYVRVVYPRVERPVSCTSLSATVLGVKMHWAEKNSFPCIRDYDSCPWCKQNLRKLWYGWILATDHVKRGTVLVQLTETAVRANAQLCNPSVDLRGAKIELERIADKDGSCVVARVTVNTWSDHSRKAIPDVWAALMRFYKIELPQLGDDYHESQGEK